jgi:predicted PurR-regulated permease PerM
MSIRNAATYALAALAVLLILFALDLVLLLFAAIIIGVILSSLANFVARLTGFPRGWSLALVGAVLIGGLGLLIWLASPGIHAEFVELREQLPIALQRLQDVMARFTWLETLIHMVPTAEAMDRPGVAGRVTGALTSTLGALVNIGIVLVIGIYLAVSPCPYVNGVIRMFPKSKRARVREVMDALYHTLRGWLGGMLISMTLVGTSMFIGLSLLGIPLAGTLALIAGLLEFIPNIGPMLGGVPAALLALTVGPNHVLYVIALFAVVQTAEAYLITPMVMKKVISLPPALTVTAQVIGALTAGWLGLLLATPAVAMVMVMVQMVYLESVLGEENARGIDQKQRAREDSKELGAEGCAD